MKQNGIISLLILLTLFACNKDPIIAETESEVRIGNNDKMVVQELDIEVLGDLNRKDSIELDINTDGIADFKITSEIWGSQELGLHPTIMVKSLNQNSFVCGRFINDTIFYHYKIDTVIEAFSDVVKIYYLSTYTCERITDKDVAVGVDDDEFVVNYFETNDALQKTDVFETGEFNLSKNWSKVVYGPITNPTNDTVYYLQDNDYFNCNSIPNYQNTYVGIKLIENTIEKLGWIKLNVEIDYRAMVLETAIQE